jgi:hypothetical protein
MARENFVLEEYFNLETGTNPLDDNTTWQEEPFNTTDTNAAMAGNVLGIELKTHDGGAAHNAFGLEPKADRLIATSTFFDTDSELECEIDVYQHSTQPGSIFFGFLDALPDGGAGSGYQDKEGGWKNADVSHGFGFWFEDGANSDMWCCVYKSTNVEALFQTAVEAEVSTSFKLKAVLSSSQLISFYINDTLVHTSSVALDASQALIPYLAVAKTNAQGQLYFSRIKLTKAYA